MVGARHYLNLFVVRGVVRRLCGLFRELVRGLGGSFRLLCGLACKGLFPRVSFFTDVFFFPHGGFFARGPFCKAEGLIAEGHFFYPRSAIDDGAQAGYRAADGGLYL